MKSKTTAALFGASLAAVAILATTAARPDQPEVPKTGAEPNIVEARLVPPAVEQYKVLSLAPFQNDADVRRMEEVLNKLAAEGWRVKTGVGVALVLSR